MVMILHTLRLVVGLAMLAAAAALARPFAGVVLATCRGAGVDGRSAQPSLPGLRVGGDPSRGAAGHAIPDPRGYETVMASIQTAAGAALDPGGSAPFAGRSAGPPGVVPPLPAAAGTPPAPPVLDGTYRSTVEIPPPPLLEMHNVPGPAADWSAYDRARRPDQSGQTWPSQKGPSHYVVRDGDDLAGIAVKIYGRAGAASAIWAANRDRLPDPNLLPIGFVLRLPPAWMLPGAVSSSGTAIEPSIGVAQAAADPGATPGNSATHSAGFWLDRIDAVPSEAATAPPRGQSGEDSPGPRRPATVRVGPGDSLESIAARFYGDPQAAGRLWQANRDRLRSPELVVPGMELRLP